MTYVSSQDEIHGLSNLTLATLAGVIFQIKQVLGVRGGKLLFFACFPAERTFFLIFNYGSFPNLGTFEDPREAVFR